MIISFIGRPGSSLAQGGDSWLSEWIKVHPFCQYLVQEWVCDTILVREGQQSDVGLWEKFPIFLIGLQGRRVLHSCPVVCILCEGVIPAATILSTMKGASPKGKSVCWRVFFHTEKKICVVHCIMSCWVNLPWNLANCASCHVKEFFLSLFKSLLVEFSYLQLTASHYS